MKLLENWDRGFESRSRRGCVSASFCVLLSCVGSGLATGQPPVQGVLPNIQKQIHKFRSQILNRNRLEGLIRIHIYIYNQCYTSWNSCFLYTSLNYSFIPVWYVPTVFRLHASQRCVV